MGFGTGIAVLLLALRLAQIRSFYGPTITLDEDIPFFVPKRVPCRGMRALLRNAVTSSSANQNAAYSRWVCPTQYDWSTRNKLPRQTLFYIEYSSCYTKI